MGWILIGHLLYSSFQCVPLMPQLLNFLLGLPRRSMTIELFQFECWLEGSFELRVCLLDINLIHSFVFFLSWSCSEIFDILNNISLFSLSLLIIVTMVYFHFQDYNLFFSFLRLYLSNFVIHHFYSFQSVIVSLNFQFISIVHFNNFLYFS